MFNETDMQSYSYSEWKTYSEWKCAGRHVREGCRGAVYNGLTLFSREQTSAAGVHDCRQRPPIDLSGDPNQLKLALPIASGS